MPSPRPVLAAWGATALLALLVVTPSATAATPRAAATTSGSSTTASSHSGELLLVGFLFVLFVVGGLFVLRRFAHPDARPPG